MESLLEFVCVFLFAGLVAGLLIILDLWKKNNYLRSAVMNKFDLEDSVCSLETMVESKERVISSLTKTLEKKKVDYPEKILEQLDRLHASFLEYQYSFKETWDVSVVAKLLDYPPNKFFAFLREQKLLMNGGDKHNVPFQRYITAGYFKVITEPYKKGPVKNVHLKPVVTYKGLCYLRNLLETLESREEAA